MTGTDLSLFFFAGVRISIFVLVLDARAAVLYNR